MSDSSNKQNNGSKGSKDLAKSQSSSVAQSDNSSALQTEHGQTVVADTVVSKIAGMAAREVSGVHDLGGGTARMVGALRERIPGGRVNVQVGDRQAAVDISIVAEYGVAIHELAEAIRKNIIVSVEAMTGLEVTEVNVTVHDVHLDIDDDDEDDEEQEQPRVQ